MRPAPNEATLDPVTEANIITLYKINLFMVIAVSSFEFSTNEKGLVPICGTNPFLLFYKPMKLR